MGEERRQCARAWLVSDAELVCSTGTAAPAAVLLCHVSDPLATVFFTGREETEDLHVLRTLLPGAIIPIHTAALSPHPAGDTG